MVRINEEFQKLIPPLTMEEYSRLEESIKTEGCRDALVFWGETLIDGHNRLKVCQKNNISYEKYYVKFEDENQAKIWIINNQLARRNLKAKQRLDLMGLLYNLEKQDVGIYDHDQMGKKAPSRTSEKIAEKFDVDESTVRKAEKFHESLNIIEDNIGKDVRSEITTGKIKSTVQDIKQLADYEPEIQQRVIGKISDLKEPKLSVAISQVREEIKAENIADMELPEQLFDVIYADPPWSYSSTIQKNANVKHHYPTMTLEKIKELAIPAYEDCILFLWVTGPKIADGLDVLEKWGFIFKGMFVWDKEIIGMGMWVRWQHEILLLGIKGKVPVPKPKNRFSSMIKERRGKHSKKPTLVYEMIEKMFPNRKYVELFAREKHSDKWNAWGNQIGT